jgi:hypothetical protein
MCIIFKSASDSVTKLKLEDVRTGKDSPQAHNGPAYRTPVKEGLHRMRAVHSNAGLQVHSKLARE